RAEKLSSRKAAIPISLKCLAHSSGPGPTPPEPCSSTTAGIRPVTPRGMRSSPAIVTALPFLSPVRNCWSVSVSVSIGRNSMRAARSLSLGSANAAWVENKPAMPMIADAVRNLPAMGFLPRHPAAHAGGPEATLEHDQCSENRLLDEIIQPCALAKAHGKLRTSIGLIALLVVAAAATIAADIVIEVAVVGELVDVVLLADRVVRVIVGDVVRLGVLARIVVDN